MIPPSAPMVPREVGAQAEHSLTQYQRGLRAAESLDEHQVNVDTKTFDSRLNGRRLAKVISVWTVVVLAIAGVATWFLDQAMAAWIVALVTAIVVSMRLPGGRRTPGRVARH